MMHGQPNIIFVLFLRTTHSFVFVNNAKLVHRRQRYPVSGTVRIIILYLRLLR